MTGSTDPQINPETNVNSQAGTSNPGRTRRRSGLVRAVLYAPVVLMLGGLAALATFPELAEFAKPLVGDSSQKYQCPIAAMMAMVNGSGSSCSSAPCCLSSSAPVAFGGCCGGGISRCGIMVEETSAESSEAPNADLTANEAPADAIAAANVNLND